ncbi:MAG: sigma 54-interacting transcriptional regulator [Polyangiaceae bacterium]|nr:sigma 54-interacting transcriptional regulator [Polyangiaceae bacterium]
MLGKLVAHRYRVGAKLGQGGLGSAYRARDEALDRDVCLKLLASEALDGAERSAHAELLRAEFAALRGLVHPNLARAHDFGLSRDDDRVVAFFTSDIAEGSALGATAWGKRWEEIAPALAGPLGALGFLHERGILHGDFKPDNVLVDPAGSATLIDLSCATRMGSRTEVVSGTRGYIAPERMRGGACDQRSDLFSVGVTLAAIGKLSRGMPTDVERLIERLTRERPAERPSSVGEVLDLLRLSAPAVGAAFGESSRVFGRDEQLLRFRDALRTFVARERGPRRIILRGAPGTGKSRLLRELKWIAQLDATTVEGYTSAVSGVLSLLRRASAESDLPASALGAVRARDRIVELGAPTVLVLDDADAAGDEQPLLDAFLRSIEVDDPILTITTETIGSERTDPSTVAGALVLELAPLGVDAVRAWLSSAHFEHATEQVARACAGVPSAVSQAIRRLTEGAPAADLEVDPGARPDGPSSIRVPSDLRARRALALLAAANEPIDPLALQSLTGATFEALDGVTLQEGGLTLLHRSSAATILAGDADLAGWAHRTWASSLSERIDRSAPASGHKSELVARSALHLALAGEESQALSLFESSAELRRVSPRPWIRACRALAKATSRDLGVELARTVQRAGEPKQAIDLLAASAQTGEATLVRAECLLELADSREALTAAMRAASDESAPIAARTRATVVAARAHIRLGAYAEALEVSNAALAREPDDDVTSELHECIGVASMFALDDARAASHLARAREAFATFEPRRKVRVVSYDAILAFRRGDLRAARDGYEEALRLAEEHGVADQIARCSLNLGTACHQRGELSRALSAYDRGERLARVLSQRDLLVVLAFNLAKLYADAGAIDRARAKATAVLADATARGARFFVASARSVLAEVAFCRGDLEEARTQFRFARDAFAEEGGKREVAEEELELGRVALALGDAEEAARCVEAARRWDGFDDAADLVVRGALLSARLAAGDGDPVRARRSLALAIVRAERAHLPELHARALAQLAEVASSQGLAGEAVEVAERARRIWSSMIEHLPAEWTDSFWSRPERVGSKEPRQAPTPEPETRGADRPRKLERLIAAFRKLNSSLETNDVLSMAMDEAIELTGAERGFVVIETGDGRGLDVPIARNLDRASIDTSHLRFSRGIAEQAIRTASAVLTVDAQSDDRFRTNVSVHAMRLRSVIAVPIRSPDGVLGALYLDNRYAQARFDDKDTDLLLAFADQVAIALRNARLVETLRRRQVELDAERQRVEELARGQAIEIDRLHEEVRVRQAALEHRFDYSAIVGKAPALQKVFSVLDRVIDSPLAVLVTGESGTGKELVARAIHFGSPRRAGPFVGINCAALPVNLLESELFGHAKGAFTGAERERKGLVVTASGGTLFLDELGEMPLDVQAKLLRVLQEKEVRPLGSATSLPVDFRLVCATNRDLKAEVAQGRFREDLYYRVGVVDVHLPPLRDRVSDLPELATHFVKRAAEQLGRPVPRLSAGAMRKLSQHTWPGNIRELENVLTKGVVLADDGEIRAVDIEPSARASEKKRTRAVVKGATSERTAILEALERTGWNAVRAARELGMPRATFYRRLRALGVERPS